MDGIAGVMMSDRISWGISLFNFVNQKAAQNLLLVFTHIIVVWYHNFLMKAKTEEISKYYAEADH